MKKKLQIAAGLLLGLFLVWFLFRDTDWAHVGAAIAGADVRWLAVATTAVVISFFTRSQRWGYIVGTAKPVPFKTLFNATQIGFFANYILPARAGELIRALVLSRREQIPFTKCVAFAALDRVTDLFGLLAVLILTVVFFHPDKAVVLPPGMELPEWAQSLLEPTAVLVFAGTTAAVLTGIVGALVVLYLNQPLALRISDAILGLISTKLAERVHEMLVHFAEGLHVFRSLRDMGLALLWSLATWACALVSFWTIIIAFHLSIPWYGACLVLAMLSIAIALPGAPGFIGQYHMGVMVPLFIAVPGVMKDTAGAVAIMSHLINLAAVAVSGAYCLHVEHMGLIALQQDSEAAAQEAETNETVPH